LVYGPHDSVRLGLSLGVDLTPMTCTFDCIYCERGRTLVKIRNPSEFRSEVCVEAFLRELKRSLAETAGRGLRSITFSGTGEPTIEPRLHEFIRAAKRESRIPIRVITNSSLLTRPKVRKMLQEADEVIAKMNTVSNDIFWSMHQPADPNLTTEKIIDGIGRLIEEGGTDVTVEVLFTKSLPGGPITNDTKMEAVKIAEALRELRPSRVQIHTVRRKPPHPLVRPVSRGFLLWVLGEFRRKLGREAVQVFI